jgi:uncharacterized membrane protein YozB (DUF420 family)
MSLPLPAVNACLNAVAALLLLLGYAAIKAGRRERHEHLMKAAAVTSAVFLASYLYYHIAIARGQPTRFNGEGWQRPAYFALLISHTVLAMINVPLVLRTLWLAHVERWDAHRRVAKITFPIWLYVSVTGVMVYVVLYRFIPAAPEA